MDIGWLFPVSAGVGIVAMITYTAISVYRYRMNAKEARSSLSDRIRTV
jgi:Tfp pilus assembly protein PilE